MIAADTSTWIAFLEGERAPDTELLDQALRDRQLLMVPVVLTELLSDPKVPVQVARTLCDVPAIEIGSEYWQRLNGRVKSGQRWSGQNRPTDVARDSDVLPCRLHIRQA